jgi:MoaA/NifB/PqqE/SkfB family radical SAM enzyme
MLSFTGGEPFVDLKRLKAMADCGCENGLLVAAVTNAFWAETRDRAVEILKELDSIRAISISCDVYHQRSIPFDRVENAVLAARELGVPFNVIVCTENEDDGEYQRLLSQLRGITEEDTINRVAVFPVGRARGPLTLPSRDLSNEPPPFACTDGGSPIVFPDGRVVACIGPVIDLRNDHPLVLGNLYQNTLEEILDRAEMNSILHAIRVWGPRKLISTLRDLDLDEGLPRQYVKDNVCLACQSLMADEETVTHLLRLAEDEGFKRKVAYARTFYLKEDRMAEMMGLGSASSLRAGL